MLNTLIAISSGMLSTMVLAGPISSGAAPAKDIVARAAQIPTTADRFSTSGMDYMTWANQQVAEGKMYWPNTTTSHQIKIGQVTWDIHDIACAFIGGKEEQYDNGRDLFCKRVHDYASAILLGAQYIVQDGVCQDSEECTLILDISMAVAGAYVHDGIPAVCDDLFPYVWNDCSGGVGGSGQLTITDSSGQQTGTIEARFYAEDEGAVCPVESDTNTCALSRFN